MERPRANAGRLDAWVNVLAILRRRDVASVEAARDPDRARRESPTSLSVLRGGGPHVLLWAPVPTWPDPHEKMLISLLARAACALPPPKKLLLLPSRRDMP